MDTSKIFPERMAYFDVGSTNEVTRDHEEGCSYRYEYGGEILQIINNLYNSPICFDNMFSLRLECNSSFHGQEIEHIIYF